MTKNTELTDDGGIRITLHSDATEEEIAIVRGVMESMAHPSSHHLIYVEREKL